MKRKTAKQNGFIEGKKLKPMEVWKFHPLDDAHPKVRYAHRKYSKLNQAIKRYIYAVDDDALDET